ncbi:signal recognition particle receptor subunit alpha, partial [Marinobacter sp.]|uniref:signal recognition particle receptor subunit alpha n=1 Tax=Marinobacter sp. TaxID=50741 RepID=UPI00259089F3
MTAEWISVGLLALLVLFFVLDIAGNRKRAPRPKPVPQRKPEVARGPAPVPAEPEAEPEVPPEPAAEAAEPEAAQPAVEPAPAPEPVPAAEPEVEREPETRVSVFERIKQGLGKTRASLTGGLADLFSVGKKIDEDLLEEIETTLLMADVGVTATSEIIDALTEKLERNQLKDG